MEDLGKVIKAFLLNVADDSQIFFAIPHVKSGDRKHLVKALQTTSQLTEQGTLQVRARSYRIFLNLVQFTNYLKDIFPNLDTSQKVKGIDLLCSISVPAFRGSLDQSLEHLMAVFDDVDWLNKTREISIAGNLLALRDGARIIRENLQTIQIDQPITQKIVDEIKWKVCL